ncbi:unnamed protein product, partial [Amoebophrya sp. A25]
DSPSLTLQDPTKDGVRFLNVFEETAKVLKSPEAERADGIMALTHQSNADDERMLHEFPQLKC